MYGQESQWWRPVDGPCRQRWKGPCKGQRNPWKFHQNHNQDCPRQVAATTPVLRAWAYFISSNLKQLAFNASTDRYHSLFALLELLPEGSHLRSESRYGLREKRK